MRFDPILLNRAWQSVAAATHTDKSMHEIAIELHETGLFLAATDSSLMLHAWVPDESHDPTDPAPLLAEPSEAQIVARDPDKRGTGLLDFVARVAADENNDPDDYVVNITIREVNSALSFPGMAASVVRLQAGGETVTLSTREGTPFDWRRLVTESHSKTSITQTALNPAELTKLVKAAKPHPNSAISATFTGVNKPIRVEIINSDPYISGALMPMRIVEELGEVAA